MKLPFGINEIQELIPHRPPFLLIDRVTEFEVGVKLVAFRAVSISDPNLSGHFPGNPVLPGVHIIEGLAQASAVLGRLTDPESRSVLLTEISGARFRKPVVPGDLLKLEVFVEKTRKPFYWFRGVASVDGDNRAEVSFSARLA